ncbi:hypothetical protein WG66_010610 [Moniliophthora roreri]|nr:hypothetical protein WG66_010610 [Moniliophthora roreri]
MHFRTPGMIWGTGAFDVELDFVICEEQHLRPAEVKEPVSKCRFLKCPVAVRTVKNDDSRVILHSYPDYALLESGGLELSAWIDAALRKKE